LKQGLAQGPAAEDGLNSQNAGDLSPTGSGRMPVLDDPQGFIAGAVRTTTCLREPIFETVSGMPKWDYKTVVLTGGFMGRHKEELKRQDLEREFDELGREGWELSWVLMSQALQGEKDGHVVIFKRPLPD
jgi:hypothetical protein